MMVESCVGGPKIRSTMMTAANDLCGDVTITRADARGGGRDAHGRRSACTVHERDNKQNGENRQHGLEELVEHADDTGSECVSPPLIHSAESHGVLEAPDRGA